MPFRILLAEDNPADADLVTECLEDWHHPVELVHVRDGVSAIERLRGTWRPDLVILDLKMPQADGLDVLEHIKVDPRLKVIPVVVMTSSTAPTDVRAAYERHANTYFQKPMLFSEYQRLLGIIEGYWVRHAVRVV